MRYKTQDNEEVITEKTCWFKEVKLRPGILQNSFILVKTQIQQALILSKPSVVLTDLL